MKSESENIALESVLAFLEDLQKAGDQDEWDRQIARDFDEGNLDFLIREADEALHDQDIYTDWR